MNLFTIWGGRNYSSVFSMNSGDFRRGEQWCCSKFWLSTEFSFPCSSCSWRYSWPNNSLKAEHHRKWGMPLRSFRQGIVIGGICFFIWKALFFFQDGLKPFSVFCRNYFLNIMLPEQQMALPHSEKVSALFVCFYLFHLINTHVNVNKKLLQCIKY